jgi:hypothetical protein
MSEFDVSNPNISINKDEGKISLKGKTNDIKFEDIGSVIDDLEKILNAKYEGYHIINGEYEAVFVFNDSK